MKKHDLLLILACLTGSSLLFALGAAFQGHYIDVLDNASFAATFALLGWAVSSLKVKD